MNKEIYRTPTHIVIFYKNNNERLFLIAAPECQNTVMAIINTGKHSVQHMYTMNT